MLLGPWLVAAAAAAAVVVTAGAGAGCPVLCTCGGQAVDCSGQRLFSVPPELPLDTGNLSLAQTVSPAIPPGYLACYGQLRALDLRNNSLAALPGPGLFLGARRLAHLDLSYNNFSLVAADMFLEASGLLRLDLSHNPGLRRVHPPRLSLALAQLRELDLSLGGCRPISLDALEGLPGLVGCAWGATLVVCGCAMEPFLKWHAGRIQRCALRSSQLAECRGPPRVAGAPLLSLTEESFQACHLTLTLDDYLLIAFVGFVVSTSPRWPPNFLLGITANCCHRWSKASEDEDV
ncbi:LOW QUALITY PROTEIN: leucine-rich repeat-containing protein 55 [Pluvialis apricaria]